MRGSDGGRGDREHPGGDEEQNALSWHVAGRRLEAFRSGVKFPRRLIRFEKGDLFIYENSNQLRLPYGPVGRFGGR